MQNHERNSLKKTKRYRSTFTTGQVNYLEERFKQNSYITNFQRKEVAFALNIPETTVKIWFANRRKKEKRVSINKGLGEESDPTSSEFAEKQLNNVMAQSNNDRQPHSLPPLTDIDNAIRNKTVVTDHSTRYLNTPQCNNRKIKATEDLIGVKIRFPKHLQSPAAFTMLHKPISANNWTKSKKDSLTPDRRLQLRASHHCNITPPTSYIKPKDMKQNTEVEMTTNPKTIEQLIPEDLSSRKNMASTAKPTLSIAVSTPGYIQMLPAISPFYSDPYYSASSVLWKPVSFVPSVASNRASVSIHIPNYITNLPINLPNLSNQPLLSYNIQQSPASPQYIFTVVPVTNPSNVKL